MPGVVPGATFTHTGKIKTMFATIAIICCTASLGSAIAIHASRMLETRRAPLFPSTHGYQPAAATTGTEWS